jgi:predicted LPLAT superfamily acyltransferase
MSAQHWSTRSETTFVAGIWFLYAVYRALGRTPFRLLLYPVVFYQWLRHAAARHASRQYLERLHAAHAVFDRAPGVRHSLRHFACFAETLLDKILALGGHYGRGRIEFHGHEAVLAALASGQGGVIVTAHMGCLELMQTAAGWRDGLRLTVLVHTAHAERFNRILARTNPTSRVRLLQVASFSPATAMLLADRIAAGEFVAIAGDRVPLSGDRVATVPFLGHAAPFPAGPYLIAAVLRCPVFLLSCLHHGGGYRVTIERFAERIVLPRAQRAAAIDAHAAAFARWIEARLRESPYDWFNFFPFWDQAPNAIASD